MTPKQLTRRQARWALFFAAFEFILTHRPGSRNGKAGILSRRGVYVGMGSSDSSAFNFRRLLDPARVINNLSQLPLDRPFLVALRQQTASDLWVVSAQADPKFSWKDGVLYRHRRIYLPTDELRLRVIPARHDAPGAGHFGFDKTFELVARDF
jgi:hypothetical protein